MLSDAELKEMIQTHEDVLRFGVLDYATIPAQEKFIAALTELAEARKLLREALPHLHHTGATHHQQCACSVKRRIEAIIRKELERKDAK